MKEGPNRISMAYVGIVKYQEKYVLAHLLEEIEKLLDKVLMRCTHKIEVLVPNNISNFNFLLSFTIIGC